MNLFSIFFAKHPSRPFSMALLMGSVLNMLAAANLSAAPTQTPVPTATPAATVAPPDSTPSPTAPPDASPTPAPSATPGLVLTPGINDLSAYTQARTPTVSVTLAPAASTVTTTNQSGAKKVSSKTASSTTATSNGVPTAFQPISAGGIFSVINLGILNGGNPPPAATITLQYDASRATTLVWIQAVDGGTLQAQGGDGTTTTAQDGFWMELNAAGQCTFTFQAPTASARYQVVVRIDNVSCLLPFVIPDPPADN